MSPLSLTLSPALLALAAIALAILVLVLALWVLLLERRIARFMRGKDAASLEGVMREILAHHDETAEFRRRMVHGLENLNARLKTAPRGTGIVRFDAFSGDGTGGRQSFAAAFISEEGDGVVISSLHARASTRIFAKPVKSFSSEHELTEEERAAIAAARERTAL
ncbi:MAG TPA: DUF4446 family protein [Candidatus Paceibacterota bacterium]|nr:DUF4446 family protein [Candidatus Paceibacterota bacterium]